MSISSYLALIIIVIVINALKSAQKKKEAEEARRMPTAKAQQPKQSAPKVRQSADCADARADARPCTHDCPCREAEGA